MFTKKLTDLFSKDLLDTVSGILGEAKKKCPADCKCDACTPEEDEGDETNEGYVPTNDLPDAHSRKVAGKLGQMLKREREAKEKRETNGVKTEEVEDLEEKRGLWDNIHAKRERIKNGSGERMRKPGSKGAPSAADLKASQTESIDPDLESELKATRQTPQSIAKWNVVRNGKTLSSHSNKDKADVKAMKHPSNKVVAKEEAELEEARIWHGDYTATSEKSQFGGHRPKVVHKEKGHTMYLGQHSYKKPETARKHAEAYLTAYSHQGERSADAAVQNFVKAHKNHMHEEVEINESFEQLDEISKEALGSYVVNAARDSKKHGVVAGLKIKSGEDSSKEFKKMKNREKGIDTAVSRLTQEEQEFIDALNACEINELSNDTLKSYAKKAMDQATSAHGYQKDAEKEGDRDRARREMKHKWKRQAGARNAIDRLGNNTLAKEEVELDEARGRPKKAGAKDFTIHPKTKEKLMHNNPEHMAKIEKLQKHGVLQKPKTEANQHIIQQLQRAKTSMRGGETVHFTHGDSTHVPGTHAAKLLDKYAGMKPDEKEAFQKKIGHSHANLKSEL